MQKGPSTSPPTSATIFEVASQAGVSITTVSHVFSGKRHVSEETRRRVHAVADRLGYRPRASARGLATGRSMTIALQHSLSSPEFALNPFFAAMLTSMSEAAISSGYSFIFVPADPPAEVFVTPLIAERRVDGAILIDPVPGDAFVDAVIALEMPAVSLGRVEGHPEKLSVDHDHGRALREVLDHLRVQGYRRPAMLSLAAEMSYVADMDAAFEQLAPAGAPVLSAAEFSERSGYELAQELLEGPDRPDAIFCVNDILAAGAARAAADQGVAIPRELGIVGVGDSVRAREAAIPLTSLRVFPERAGTLLLELIEVLLASGEQPEPPDPLPTELSSAGRPAAP